MSRAAPRTLFMPPVRATTVLCVLLCSASASAQTGGYQPSPKRWMFELKFGPYKPAVDSEPGLTGKPYQDIFGCMEGQSCGKSWPGYQVMSQIEVDLELWQGHGALGLAATWGFFRIEGKALVLSDPGLPYDPDTNPYVRSGDKTSLNIMPFILQAVYRWDYAFRRWSVPLIPYFKGGVVWDLWWIEKADRHLARFGQDGGKAWGGTFGYQINVGLSFALDILEPSAAKKMDMELGINHTYLFAEFVHSQVRWASGDRMRLGLPYGFMVGLALEF